MYLIPGRPRLNSVLTPISSMSPSGLFLPNLLLTKHHYKKLFSPKYLDETRREYKTTSRSFSRTRHLQIHKQKKIASFYSCNKPVLILVVNDLHNNLWMVYIHLFHVLALKKVTRRLYSERYNIFSEQ